MSTDEAHGPDAQAVVRRWVQLAATVGLGPILIRRLVESAGSAEKACALSRGQLMQVEGIGEIKAKTIHESLQSAEAEAERQLRKAGEYGARVICYEEEDYPPLLREIQDPPVVLFVLGDLQPRDLNGLAIVGSRRCSYYGREQAERFGAILAAAGFTIISGGARGIDSAAHRGAMQPPEGRTIAVLGSGLDVVYPPENDELFKQIAKRGAVISEFLFGTPPTAENFPRRNRVVSGMSRGVFVIEADERSGALITARLANEDHGRPVFALPGRVDNKMSIGPHLLIRDGAILVSQMEDIVEGLDPLPDRVREAGLFDTAQPDRAAAPKPAVVLSDRQQDIVDKMGREPVTVDELVEQTHVEAGMIMGELTMLTLKGLVKRVDGQRYVRAKG
ncbi:MAG TPA: DNA-processing protein DprA [Tepidisphaeraceae bacterium]|nr:DNA-processing protein DprA [Tepidisphaeraceae bacterium]